MKPINHGLLIKDIQERSRAYLRDSLIPVTAFLSSPGSMSVTHTLAGNYILRAACASIASKYTASILNFGRLESSLGSLSRFEGNPSLWRNFLFSLPFIVQSNQFMQINVQNNGIYIPKGANWTTQLFVNTTIPNQDLDCFVTFYLQPTYDETVINNA